MDFRRLPGPYAVFTVGVRDVKQAGAIYEVKTRVVRDIDPEQAGRPGADGHCGIEGIEEHKKNGPALKRSKAVRDEIASRCRRVEDAPEEPEPEAAAAR